MEENNNQIGAEESNSTAPASTEATAEEIRKAKELLRANGYGLVAYRDAGEKIKRTVGSGVSFVKGKCKAFGGWLSAKRGELKARQEERRLAEAEKLRLAAEAEMRRVSAGANVVYGGSAATGSDDVPKCAACGAGLVPGARFCRKCGKQVSVAQGALSAEQPAEAKSVSATIEDPAGSDAPKCAACGATLAAGVKFCGECGTPVNAGGAKPRKRKTTRPRKNSQNARQKSAKKSNEDG